MRALSLVLAALLLVAPRVAAQEPVQPIILLAQGSDRPLGHGVLLRGNERCLVITASHVLAGRSTVDLSYGPARRDNQDRSGRTLWAGEDDRPDFAIVAPVSAPEDCAPYPTAPDIGMKAKAGVQAEILRSLPDGGSEVVRALVRTVHPDRIELTAASALDETARGMSGAPVLIDGVPVAVVSGGLGEGSEKVTIALRLDYGANVAGGEHLPIGQPAAPTAKATAAATYDLSGLKLMTRDGFTYWLEGGQSSEVKKLHWSMSLGDDPALPLTPGAWALEVQIPPSAIGASPKVFLKIEFYDGSVTRAVTFDPREAYDRLRQSVLAKPQDWLHCYHDLRHLCSVKTGDYAPFVSRILAGSSATEMDYTVALSPTTTAEPGTTLAGHQQVLAFASDQIYYQFVFSSGERSEVRTFTPRPCTTLKCTEDRLYVMKARTAGAPRLHYAFSTTGGDRLEVRFPPAFGGYRLRYDNDGRGFLDHSFKHSHAPNLTLTNPGTSLSVVFVNNDGETLGPYDYTADLKTPVMATIPARSLSFLCRKSKVRPNLGVCWLESPLTLSTVKEVRYRTSPTGAFKRLALNVFTDWLLDPKRRARMQRCPSATSEPACEELFRELGASVDVPPNFTDLYFQIVFRDGEVSEVKRRPVSFD